MAAGKLEVNVTANTSQLKQGLQESTASVEKAANQMNLYRYLLIPKNAIL